MDKRQYGFLLSTHFTNSGVEYHAGTLVYPTRSTVSFIWGFCLAGCEQSVDTFMPNSNLTNLLHLYFEPVEYTKLIQLVTRVSSK